MAKIQEDMPDLVVGVDFGMTYTGSPPRFHKASQTKVEQE
jgi:hypothetical protein